MKQRIASVSVFTDGSSFENPGGPGGWAALIRDDSGRETLRVGGATSTTNNRMELCAIMRALEYVLEKYGPWVRVSIHTDSQYAIKCCTGVFKRNVNHDLFYRFDCAYYQFVQRPEFHWVKGHSGHVENERVDVAARAAAVAWRKLRDADSAPAQVIQLPRSAATC